MTFNELDSVVLERDLREHGLRKGDLGAVVHVHSASLLEVEFVRVSGRTQTLVQLEPAAVRPVAEEMFRRCVPAASRGEGPHNKRLQRDALAGLGRGVE